MPRDPSIRRIAITGIGIVAPEVLGALAFADRVEAGQSFISEITRFDTGDLRSHRAGLIRDFSAKGFIPPMKMRRMNYLSRMGLVAAKLALTDVAEEQPLSENGNDIGVAIGTMFGPVQTSVDYLLEYVEKGAALAPPQLFAESVANAPGSHIAIEHGFRGFNLTFTQREGSVLAAAMFAGAQILKGSVQSVIVGGVEEINEITFSVLDRIRALATASEDETEEARPFDVDRTGIVVGEGSAMFVFESEERASKLERRVYAFVTGFGIARDVSASLSNWGTDTAAGARAMHAAMDDAGVAASEIDAIWASANGSIAGDRVEAAAIREVFGERVPPVVATKSLFGEYAAAGGLHLASAVMGLYRQRLPATPGFRAAETGLELPVVLSARDHSMRRVLVNSLSAGGGIISAILESVE